MHGVLRIFALALTLSLALSASSTIYTQTVNNVTSVTKGKTWVGLAGYEYYHGANSSTSGKLRVYLLDSKLVFALSTGPSGSYGSCGPSSRSKHCTVQYGVSAFPSGAVKLATIDMSSTNNLLSNTLVDERQFGGANCN